MSVAEVVAIGRQLVDALDAAHEKGIVHRDLKPANIILTPDRVVKVLDFGLAKAESADQPASGALLTNSPTLLATTREGVILGTAAYMSPEQARGRVVDKRTDIWAFGCVIRELLTGRPAFRGDTVSDLIAAILQTDPDWGLLPRDTPSVSGAHSKGASRRTSGSGCATLPTSELTSTIAKTRPGRRCAFMRQGARCGSQPGSRSRLSGSRAGGSGPHLPSPTARTFSCIG